MPKQLPSNTSGTSLEAGDLVKGISGLDVGLRLVGGVLGLGAVGFAMDHWLGTLPWLMLVGIVLGFVGWMVDVVMRSRKQR